MLRIVLFEGRMQSPFTPKTLSFLRALKRNNDREWFRARKEEYERHVRGPMVELISRLAGDLRRLRAGARRRSEDVAVPDLSRHALQRGQDAAEDQRRRRVPAARLSAPRRRRPLRRDRARVGVDGRRSLHAAAGVASRHPRAHRRHASPPPPHGDGQGVCRRARRAAGRSAHTRAARYPSRITPPRTTSGSSSFSAFASSSRSSRPAPTSTRSCCGRSRRSRRCCDS